MQLQTVNGEKFSAIIPLKVPICVIAWKDLILIQGMINCASHKQFFHSDISISSVYQAHIVSKDFFDIFSKRFT